MSVSGETDLAKTERAALSKIWKVRSEDSLPLRIREKQSVFPFFSLTMRDFSRKFADHLQEWIMLRREKPLTAEEIMQHHQFIREANRRLYWVGEKVWEHKPKRKKPAVTPPPKDERPPFEVRGQRLSLATRKRMNNVGWVKPGRTKHVKGALPINTKEFIKG